MLLVACKAAQETMKEHVALSEGMSQCPLKASGAAFTSQEVLCQKMGVLQ